MPQRSTVEENPRRAEELLAESQTIGQRSGRNPFHTGWTLNHLGHSAQLHGKYERASELHQESLAYFDAGYQVGLLWADHGLGESALGLGNLDEAARWLAQALPLKQAIAEALGEGG